MLRNRRVIYCGIIIFLLQSTTVFAWPSERIYILNRSSMDVELFVVRRHCANNDILYKSFYFPQSEGIQHFDVTFLNNTIPLRYLCGGQPKWILINVIAHKSNENNSNFIAEVTYKARLKGLGWERSTDYKYASDQTSIVVHGALCRMTFALGSTCIVFEDRNDA